VETDCYSRSISLNGKDGYFEVSLQDEHNALAVRLQFADPRSLAFIIERIRAMFDLNADWAVISKVLRTDGALAGRVDAHAGLRVPGCWSGFELMTRAILGQQLSVQRATKLAGRMVSTFGRPLSATNNLTHLFPEPTALADADLTSIGVPTGRARTIRALARAVCDGQIRTEGIADCATFLKRLREVPGLAKSTAQYLTMRVLRDPDAFPAAELTLLGSVANCTTRELERRSEAWRPWRAYAALLLWQNPAQPAAAVPKT
jgi:AraC family transcriptional regulator, regulatory protein of adaptative response / DNA-3-methyladenine glycosylase II